MDGNLKRELQEEGRAGEESTANQNVDIRKEQGTRN
jgi:hypothetical protein